MKRKFIFSAAVIVGIVLGALAQDFAARTIRYRNGTTISLDGSVRIKDEDVAWTLTPAQLGKLSLLQFGTATTVNVTKVTNTFTTPFGSTPVVTVAAGTNDLPHLVTVTTTNVIFGAATTNASIRWIAIGSP